ncbi:MAG: hypothetical protein ACRDKY_00380 [Solirubrobacteraceae bacterium]
MSTPPPPSPVLELREAIDTLPEHTRRAMIVGLSSGTVITGGFVERGGGVCPAVAAATSATTVRRLFRKLPEEGVRCATFPEAWDRFCGVHGRGITRPATAGEVRVLRVQLCESLAASALSQVSAAEERRSALEAQRRRERLAAEEDAKRALRARRARRAQEVGLDWLFEETLVLPEDFDALEPPAPMRSCFGEHPGVCGGQSARSVPPPQRSSPTPQT